MGVNSEKYLSMDTKAALYGVRVASAARHRFAKDVHPSIAHFHAKRQSGVAGKSPSRRTSKRRALWTTTIRNRQLNLASPNILHPFCYDLLRAGLAASRDESL